MFSLRSCGDEELSTAACGVCCGNMGHSASLGQESAVPATRLRCRLWRSSGLQLKG